MDKKLKIGLLPLWISIYDWKRPSPSRKVLEPFYDEVAEMFKAKGLDVVTNTFCGLKPEFEAAVSKFEAEKCDCIVTLHMAYSPSLESLSVLLNTKLPLVVCDTTVTFDYNPMNDPIDLDYNHGIHGVMDMCSMLRQNGRKYAIAAGHYKESDVIDRTIGLVKASVGAKSMRGLKIGSIGGSFDGMGDFLIDKKTFIKTFGVDVDFTTPDEVNEINDTITDDEIAAVKADYAKLFKNFGDYTDEETAPMLRANAVIRKWIKKHDYDGFSVNFLKIGTGSGLVSMPFAEACEKMKEGVGYAGEGDILTAALCKALMNGFGKENVSFMEIFCPDWKGNRLYLSHMGEINPSCTAGDVTIVKNNFRYAPGVPFTFNPSACFKPGKIAYVNLCLDSDGYKIVTS